MKAILTASVLLAAAAPAYAAGFDNMTIPGIPALARQTASVACKALSQETVYKGSGQFKRLDQLPPAVLEHAVLRSVEGCPVREIVYQGQTYFVQPSVPTIEPAAPRPYRDQPFKELK